METEALVCRCFSPFKRKKKKRRKFDNNKNKKHGLSDQQFQDLKLAFSSFDKNNDGYIDIKEIKVLMKQIGASITQDDIKVIMNEVGENNNDKITLSDFIKIMTSPTTNKKDLYEQEILQAFEQLDKNDDGYISEEELKILSKEVLGEFMLNDDDIIRMMQEADLNGDGLVDFHEFKTAILQEKPVE